MNIDGLDIIICEAPLATEIPKRIKVVPWGLVETASGTFEVDDAAAHQIVATYNREGLDLVVDYEHQTLGGKYAAPDGAAPAAGWIKSLDAVPGVGIFGNVEWTPMGRQALAAKEYRYLSPVVVANKNGGRAVYLHSVALTNVPAIRNDLPALVCSLSQPGRGVLASASPVAFRGQSQLVANADSLGSSNDRRSIIAEAGQTYDAAPDVQRICARENFISESLVIAGLTPLSDGERSTARVPATNRTELIRELGKQWAAETLVQKLCPDRGHYVDGLLAAAGLPPRTELERSIT